MDTQRAFEEKEKGLNIAILAKSLNMENLSYVRIKPFFLVRKLNPKVK